MASSSFAPIKDYPTAINIPPNAPPYMKAYVDQVELWCRDASRAIRQLQEKVSALESPPAD
jgi:hypothetical protein